MSGWPGMVTPQRYMTPFLRKILGMNWVLILVMYGLLIFGVFMIESAARHLPISAELRDRFGGPGAYYAWMQKRNIVLGSVVFFGVALVDYRWIRWLGLPFYGVSLVMMLAVMQQDDSVHRLTLGSLIFQPAQLGITAGILLIAWLLQDLPKLHPWLGAPLARIGMIGVLAGVPFLVVMKMGDMGSALVWIPVSIVALLIGGVPFRHLSFMALIGAGVLPILYFVVLPMVSERGPERIDLWLRMLQGQEVDTTGDGYSAHYATMAVGKAGWKGVGWGAPAERNSLFAKGYPSRTTAHTDYIFVVIGEELGFRGSLLLLSAYALLLLQCLFVAFYSRDMCGRLLVSLVIALLFAHVFESIGMCVLLLPITGIPLPLISYSGTFVVICMFLLGLVQSVWIHRNQRPIMPLKPVPD
ncbi:MAG: FtsW/RodA/SpoVE family cell cycle protein [Verrucomicrobia bacterium]|nr:FtsW/RodA/SpoVE family cell cycle protein [Verrucomicrobiota bacterium]